MKERSLQTTSTYSWCRWREAPAGVRTKFLYSRLEVKIQLSRTDFEVANQCTMEDSLSVLGRNAVMYRLDGSTSETQSPAKFFWTHTC